MEVNAGSDGGNAGNEAKAGKLYFSRTKWCWTSMCFVLAWN